MTTPRIGYWLSILGICLGIAYLVAVAGALTSINRYTALGILAWGPGWFALLAFLAIWFKKKIRRTS